MRLSTIFWQSLSSLVVTTTFLPVLIGNAYAQENSVSAISLDQIDVVGTEKNKKHTVEDIYKKQQGTPSSVKFIDKNQIEQDGIRVIRDLSGVTSNFTSFDGGGNRMTQLSIRGVREQSYQSSPEILPSVAYYIDDVPSLTILGRASLFNNIDSITLKKGPQNGTYGFSRPGGVIDLKSPDPTNKFSGYAIGSYGNYNAHELAFGVSAPIIKDKVFLSVDAIKAGRKGFYDNTALGGDYGEKDGLGGRLKLRVKPVENTTIDFNLQYQRFQDEADPYILLPQSNPNPFSVNFDRPGFENIDQSLQSLRVKSEFENFDFLSVTAHRKSTWSYNADAIQYGFDGFIGTTDEKVKSFTQEIRLNSKNSPNQFAWNAGLFYARTDMDFEVGSLFNNGAPTGAPSVAVTNSDDFSLFGEVSVPIFKDLKVEAGIRYEWADRKATNQFAPPSIAEGDKDFNEFIPSLSLIYQVDPNFSLFAKYVRGFKAGGFNARTSTATPFEFEYDSELSDNFEIGAKALMLNGKLGVNAALFYSDFDNYHNLIAFDPRTFGIRNAEKASTYGFEIEGNYQFSPELRLFANFGYVNAEFDSYQNSATDFSGKEISFSPEFTAGYGFEYNAKSGLYFSAKAHTVGSYFLDNLNTVSQDSYTLVDLVAGYRWGMFDASVYVKNLTNEEYVVTLIDLSGPGAYLGSLGDPMTFGVKLKSEF